MLAGEVLWESWGSREENRDETMASIFSSRQTRFVLAVRWVGSPCKSLLLLRVKYIFVAHLHPPFLAETCSPVCVNSAVAALPAPPTCGFHHESYPAYAAAVARKAEDYMHYCCRAVGSSKTTLFFL